MENVIWEKYEEYLQEQNKRAHALDRYRNSIEEATREVQKKQAEYNALITREVVESIDLTAEKEIAKQAEKRAIEALSQAQEDLEKASQALNTTFKGITVDELMDDWNQVFTAQVQKSIVEPVENALKVARAMYFEAFLKAYELKEPLRRLWETHKEGIFKGYRRNRAYVLPSGIYNFRGLPHITDADLQYVQRYRKLPDRDQYTLKEMENEEDAD